MTRITGYSDEISVCPGETIKFMVNCELSSYQADIVRLVCGDTNPDGPGYKEDPIKTSVSQRYKGRRQTIYAGSYGIVESCALMEDLQSFSVQTMIWPTTPAKGEQGLLTKWNERNGSGFGLIIDEGGTIGLRLGDGAGNVKVISTGKRLIERKWYFAAASYDAESGRVCVYQEPLVVHAGVDDRGVAIAETSINVAPNKSPLIMAGQFQRTNKGRKFVHCHYNGKIDSPRLVNCALERSEMEQIVAEPFPDSVRKTIVGAWDFSRDIMSVGISDASSNQLDGTVVNLPTRAMIGHNWTGVEMCWRHAPEQYGAIHFHDDDLYDAGWDVDFEFTVPANLRSGVYAARLHSGKEEEYIPFVVRPRPGREAKIAFLLPTFDYMAYANEHMMFNAPAGELWTGQLMAVQPVHLFLNQHREYGCSLYDSHSDGSGVSYSSRLRPMLNMRPKVQTQWSGFFGSKLREFNHDLFLVDWLDAMGQKYDVITDEDLHKGGLDILRPYQVILTGNHPEYYTKQMWDAVYDYTHQGGRLMYLGGNGFFWRCAYHSELPGVLEVRRNENGTRTWEGRPGEFYHSFTGEFGGVWRSQGHTAPQVITGVGFTAVGFDRSSYYRRTEASLDPRAAFIFEDIGDDELIGDFGYHGGGAAGNEIDRADQRLGTPPHALVLASSENHGPLYLLVVEEIIMSSASISGIDNDMVRADIVFYETPNGGAVFSVGSIAFISSLPWNDYDNNVSRMVSNVLARFADPLPLPRPIAPDRLAAQ